MDQDYTANWAILTKTIQRLVTPIIEWITALEHNYEPRPGGFVDAFEALKRVQIAIENLLKRSDQVIGDAEHNNTLSAISIDSLKKARSDVLGAAELLLQKGNEFAHNTSDVRIRQQMVEHGRSTLSAVAQLLIVADMVEARKIEEAAEYIRETLDHIRQCTNTEQLVNITRVDLQEEIEELTKLTRRRIFDLIKRKDQENLQSAVALLKITTPIMISASKVCIGCQRAENLAVLQHAEQNRKFAFANMNDALDSVSKVINGQTPSKNAGLALHSGIDPLITNLELFKRDVYMEPLMYQPHIHRGKLEEILECVAVLSANVADDEGTQPSRRINIVNGVNNLRQALQDLLKEYERNKGKNEASEDLDTATVHLDHKLRDLRRHLRRAIVDQVSDAFSTIDSPLQMLILYAKQGDQTRIQQAAELFQSHSDNLCRVAQLVCKMSSDLEGVTMLRYSAHLLHHLTPQVVNAAFLRCLRLNDPEADENLKRFSNLWNDRAKAMTLAIDSLISVDDFLAIAQEHINDDVKNGVTAIYQVEPETLDRVAGTIRGRCIRICDVVDSAMEVLPTSSYTEAVRNASLHLKKSIPEFESRAEQIVMNIQRMADSKTDSEDARENEFNEMVNACEIIDLAVQDIRRAILLNRNAEDVDSDNEYEEETATILADQRSQVSDSQSNEENQQRVMRHLPEEHKREIQMKVEGFMIIKRKFEYEVGRWDENGNDIIALAKQMCLIMMNMTDFTKGRGPYRTTMDVIKAAQEISEKGDKLKIIAHGIGSESVESDTKKSLFAIFDKIILFCHQLNMLSKVKAEVQVVDDELKVSGLEAVTSLIQTAKNLLNAVIEAVKLTYIASTKYRRKESQKGLVEWKMAPPQKQPLFNHDTNVQNNGHGIVRRVSEKRSAFALHAMNNGHGKS